MALCNRRKRIICTQLRLHITQEVFSNLSLGRRTRGHPLSNDLCAAIWFRRVAPRSCSIPALCRGQPRFFAWNARSLWVVVIDDTWCLNLFLLKQKKIKINTLIPALCFRQRAHLTVPARPVRRPAARFSLTLRSYLKGHLRSWRVYIHVE